MATKRAASTWGSRVISVLLSPLRRALVDPVADVQRRTIALLSDYDAAMTDISARLEQCRAVADSAQKDAGAASRGIDSLRGDSKRTMKHLASLQEDHNRFREIMKGIKADPESLKRTNDLWADLHRDMAVLAEAFSRLEND